jgi:hypothetical protein
MLQTISRLDKLTALRRVFKQRNMLVRNIVDYTAACYAGNPPPIQPWRGSAMFSDDASDDNEDLEVGPLPGPKANTIVSLPLRYCKSE